MRLTEVDCVRGRPTLFSLAPDGVCRAAFVTKSAVRSYHTLSPLPVGGILSVALSLRLPSLDVIQHPPLLEPGLSSLYERQLRRPKSTITRIETKSKNGAQRRNRTTDTGIFSPLLYQLSYLGQLHMARSGGFEPPTPRLGLMCSVQLSYERLQAPRG